MKRLTINDVNTLYKSLQNKINEKDVENAWRNIFIKYFVENNPDKNAHAQISSPFDTDGFISTDNMVFALRLLLEFKDGTDLINIVDRSKVITQVVHYMKKFAENGVQLPNVIVGADENQAFVLYAPNFYKYLERDYNWGIPPSSAHKYDPQLMKDLMQDPNMSVWVYDLQVNQKDRYSIIIQLFSEVEHLVDEEVGTNYKVKVTASNISGLFSEFQRIALKKPSEVPADEAVNIFMQLLVGRNDENYFPLPANPDILHTPGDRRIEINGAVLNAFFKHFDRNLRPSEIDKLVEIADRLIEDTSRRRKGDFWTPTIWANRADELLKETLGESYKTNSIVWDCAAGTKNLTRDFVYSNLYVSTYHDSELRLGQQYSQEAKATFQYDFLNDDIGKNLVLDPTPQNWKMPDALFYELIEASRTNKRVIFYTNPPYGTANNVQADGSSKQGMAKTAVNIWMKDNGFGKSSQQLYAQFFARVLMLVEEFDLKNVVIGFFTKPRHFAGGDYWEGFNERFFSKFEFVKGLLLNSGEFSDTSDTWPITFSVYKLRETQLLAEQAKKIHSIFSIEETIWNEKEMSLEVKTVESKEMYTVYSDESLSTWVREPLIKIHLEEAGHYPQLSSAMKLSKGKSPRGKLYKNSLGYMVNNSNNIGEGLLNSGVWLVTGSGYKGNGFNVMPENFNRSIVNFTARRCVNVTWYNEQDNYKLPNSTMPRYEEFVNDCLVYSIFDNASYQAAYRKNGYSNLKHVPNKWANQWFWLDIEKVKEFVDEYRVLPVYNDTRNDENRFVANEIKNRFFSKEAQSVLEAATKVWVDTLLHRELGINVMPDMDLESWDAGWFQIKQLEREFPVESMNSFRESFSKLKEKVNRGVYYFEMLIE